MRRRRRSRRERTRRGSNSHSWVAISQRVTWWSKRDGESQLKYRGIYLKGIMQLSSVISVRPRSHPKIPPRPLRQHLPSMLPARLLPRFSLFLLLRRRSKWGQPRRLTRPTRQIPQQAPAPAQAPTRLNARCEARSIDRGRPRRGNGDGDREWRNGGDLTRTARMRDERRRASQLRRRRLVPQSSDGRFPCDGRRESRELLLELGVRRGGVGEDRPRFGCGGGHFA